jgi:hypothetical protein
MGVAALGACATAPQTAEFSDVAELRATIEIIDPVTRQVLLRGEDGRVVSVVAGPEIRNFDQLEAGDRVVAFYAESIAARMAQPEEASVTRTGVAAERAEPGERPGAASGMALESVVEWVSYDAASGVSTFVGPSGLTHSVVTPETMRAFAASRRPGDRVHIDYTLAVAVGIEAVPG